ncbi:glycosyltransferase family 4 protein [Luteolibacter sp. LG18]|uniref:glycosyltransferase family 4 protein n=1 Tax=Luteolibacter sp. LG18 TaxID=2819286 RepID=UPI002B2DD6F1|nr:glycosyl transferase [Luteolibacter sp. LG18]
MSGPAPIRHVLLLAQVEPPIHGQAIMASLLAREAARWEDCRFTVVNAAYATDRAGLGGFSFGKVLRWFGYLVRVTKEIVFQGVDTVVMTHAFFKGPFLKDSAFVWLVKGLLRKRLFAWVHMDPSRLGFGSLPGWLARHAEATLQLPDRWVACSPALTYGWPREIPADKATAVCNGIPDPAGDKLATPADSKRVVFLSAMTEEKGWRELFEVGRRLCAESVDLEIAFYGGAGAGETEESLQRFFVNGPFPDRMTWYGATWGEDKAAALRAGAVFCLPSWTEAFPLAVLDAMAFGLPVIATRVGGVADAVVPGNGGWLVPARDEAALEAALREALGSSAQRRTMGEFNRARFLENFSVEAFGRAWHRLIQAA